MAFPARLLGPGEEVVVYARPHWKYLARPVAASVIVLAGAVAALVYDVPRWSELALAALLVACLLWLAGRYLQWATTSFVVTTDRLVMRRGVLRRTTRDILLDRLTDISCKQSLLDRVLRCGDVMIESPGRDSPEVFPDLPRPSSIQSEIYKAIKQHRYGSMAQP